MCLMANMRFLEEEKNSDRNFIFSVQINKF